MRTVFIIALCVGIALAGQSKIREARKKREFTLSFSQGGSTTCQGDQLTNCASYTKSVCSNPEYSKWVADNCCAYCGVGGVSGGGMPPAPQTTSGFNLVFATNAPQMGGGGSCQDAIPNCASYTSSVCTDPSYSDWVHTNCAHFCNKCGGAGVTNHPVPIMGSTCQDKLPNCASYAADVCTSSSYAQWAKDNCANFCHLCGSTETMGLTAGPMPIGMMPTSGTMPVSGGMTGGCTDVSSNCAQLNSASHICTDSGALIYAQQNCARTCNMCSGGSQPQMSTSSCSDKMPNCAAYGAGVCSDPTYSAWVSDNCQAFCHKCSSGGGSVPMGGSVPTGGGSGGSISGQSSGCVYNGQMYSQGQTWKDACKFSCTCVDGSSGKYQCQQICVTWDLPPQCTLNPPAAGKCCSTPNCPAGFNIQYPPGYVAN